MAKKTTRAQSVPEIKPSVHLEGKSAQKMMNQPVGKKVRFMVEAEITSQSVRQDWDDPKQKRHSVGMEIHKMKPVEKSKPAPKRKK